MSAMTSGFPTQRPDPQTRAADTFRQEVGRAPEGVWVSPGRVNLIGEHTDYNDGYVLPLALPQLTAAAVARRADGELRVRSLQQPSTPVQRVAELSPGNEHDWSAYVAGVVWALQEAGHDVPGLDIVVDGNVPSGAGLSSSAALECAVVLALDDLLELGLDRTTLAALARTAENDFVGAPTGVMDQMASLHGRRGHALFLDTRTMAVRRVPFALAAQSLALLVIDSKADHALVDGAYAERRRSCEEGARVLGVRALRDVTGEGLADALSRIDDEVVRRRVRHVVTEDDRVLEVVAVLDAGRDPREIGPLMTASHTSMRDDFEITVAEVDLAVQTALAAGAHGARMTGGGFGGCVLALVEAAAVEAVSAAVTEAYAAAAFTAPEFFVAEAADGSRRVS